MVADVALGGLDETAARAALEATARRARTTPLPVAIASRVFQLDPESVGLEADVDGTVAAALAAGRSCGVVECFRFWLRSLSGSHRVALAVRIDAARVERAIDGWEGEAVEDSPFAGGLAQRDGRLHPEYPRAGTLVDRPRAMETLVRSVARGNGLAAVLPLVHREAPVGKDDVDRVVAEANALLGAVVLQNPGESARLELSRDDVASMLVALLVTTPRPALEVRFDEKAVEARLGQLRSQLEEPPRSARFEVKGDRIELVPSRAGTLVRAAAVAAALLEAARRPDRRGALPVERSAAPEVTTEDLARLGIRGHVASFTTYHACCEDRVKNIHRIAELLDGTIVPPGAVFSVNETLGPRRAGDGFVPAPSIADGEMVPTIGGGISQFATTFFNTIFDGGYDVVTRQPHSYWFPRYPEGIEATLSYPTPDLAFRNDSEAAVLVKTFVGPTHVTVRLFGDNGGRRVRRLVSRRFDVVQPPVDLEADDALKPDEEKVRYGGQAGWTVVVTREVTFSDGKKKEEKRKVVYLPRPRVVAVHSCKIPEGKPGHTGEKCPVAEADGGVPTAGSFDADAGH